MKFTKLVIVIFKFVKLCIYAGLPQGQKKSGNQEKSEKTKKSDKSQEKSGKNGGFFKKVRKKSGKIFIKTSDIVSSNLFNSFYFKAFD